MCILGCTSFSLNATSSYFLEETPSNSKCTLEDNGKTHLCKKICQRNLCNEIDDFPAFEIATTTLPTTTSSQIIVQKDAIKIITILTLLFAY